MFLANEVFDMAVQFEKNGEAVYRSAVSNVPDPALAALLEWMADEESRHAAFFSRLKAKKAAGRHPFSRELTRELLDEMIGEQTFSLGDADFSAIEHQEELIRIFLEFEKDTIIFYEMLTPFIEDAETRASVETIIDEENTHIERLKVFLDREETHPAFTDC
ncbi:ferritin family protein [Desulfococcus sp.]|uniref:ferritin-like domain-containing protein n=1 Tax=Desulfococcus sp. TaxID=2025834 RepID=UPI003592F7B4